MKFSNYILLMFSICTVLYFVQYQPIVTHFLDKGDTPVNIECLENDPFCTEASNEEEYKENTIFGAILLLIAAAGGAIIVLMSGYSAIYILPLLLLMAILNFIIFPLSFVMDPNIPDIISYPLVLFFNIITVLAAISFIRGEV